MADLSLTNKQNNFEDSVLSRRMLRQLTFDRIHDVNDSYMRRVSMNCYSEKNPLGIVNLGTAFSYVCDDLMEQRLKDIEFKEVILNEDRKIWHSTSYQGNITFRRDLANFFSAKFNAKMIDPENLVVINGTTSALDCLAHCIADNGVCPVSNFGGHQSATEMQRSIYPIHYDLLGYATSYMKLCSDVILIPTPAYTYLYRNINLRAEVDFLPVDLAQNDGEQYSFPLTAAKVESAIVAASEKGKNVRGLILVNPNNPLGKVYKEELVCEILKVCCRYKIHVILDEIHSLTVFDESTPFQSAISYKHIPDPDRTHILWSFSKDFCAPGFRIAIVHSTSSEMIRSLCALGCFFMVPNLEQKLCSQFIGDTEFLEGTFFPIHMKRLRESHAYVTQSLTDMGVRVIPSTSGFVLMADFSKFLTERSKDGERELVERFLNEGIYITPGHLLCCTAPGWFRVVASHPQELLRIAMNRIEKSLK